MLEVDAAGLDRLDREILRAICEKFGGGPVGLCTLAVAVGEEPDTIEDVYEPYLLQQGYLMRTPRGRVATDSAFAHLGLEPPRGGRSASSNLPFRQAPTLDLSCRSSSARTAATAANPPSAPPGSRPRAKACKRCGFGFLFELLDDYYPAPNAAFFILDQQGRLIGTGRGARELTGLGDLDVIGRPVNEVLDLEFDEGDDHIATALEWGVRVLDKPVVVHAEGDRPEPAKADIFPAYDDDGGLLLVLTPR